MVKYISIHIPKTAGTTLGYLLDYGSNRRIFWDYSSDYSNILGDADFINKHKEFIDKHFDVIHGHIYYRKYATIFSDANFITCVRHPVKRVISQYMHILAERNENHWAYKAFSSGNMDIVDYASIPAIGNAQTVHLEGREIYNFDFVFISESFNESFTLFQKMFGFKRNDELSATGTFPVLNHHRKRGLEVNISEDVQRKIFEKTDRDNELYRQAVSNFMDLKKKFLG